jgi:hypothetical protein
MISSGYNQGYTYDGKDLESTKDAKKIARKPRIQYILPFLFPPLPAGGGLRG